VRSLIKHLEYRYADLAASVYTHQNITLLVGTMGHLSFHLFATFAETIAESQWRLEGRLTGAVATPAPPPVGHTR